MINSSKLEKYLAQKFKIEDYQQSTYIFKKSFKGKTTQIVFTPLLISYFLSEVNSPTCKKIASKILFKIKTQQSKNKTWNYLNRDMGHKYPDDLDSTTLFYLSRWNLDLANRKEILADFVKKIILQEESPGGPYRTWFYDKNDPTWGSDLDLIINQRISDFLDQVEVKIPKLQEWLKYESKQRIKSAYYPEIESQLIWLTHQKAKDYSNLRPQNLFESARLVTKLVSGDTDRQKFKKVKFHYQKIIRSNIKDLKPFPSFLDNISEKQECWVGSTQLTIAACLNAINTYEAFVRKKELVRLEGWARKAQEAELKRLIEPFQPDLKKNFQSICLKQIRFNNFQWLCFFPIFLKNYSKHWPKLAISTLFGWIGYGLYDHIIDGESSSKNNLVMARILINLSFDTYLNLIKRYLKNEKLFSDWLLKVFKKMEETYFFDSEHNLSKLPAIGWEKHIYHRALGLIIAPTISELLKNEDPKLLKHIEMLSKPLIVAKQLSDDLRDWQEDWVLSRATPVTFELAKAFKSGPEISKEQTEFVIKRISPQVLKSINNYLKLVKKRLSNSKMKKFKYFFEDELIRLATELDKQLKEIEISKHLTKTFFKPIIPPDTAHLAPSRPN